MWTTNALLLLLSASCFAQGEPQSKQQPQQGATVIDICSVQSATITCTCRANLETLNLTASFMAGGGIAEELRISGCTSVTFAFPPLQKLHTLSVSDTAKATFQEKASQLLRHLTLANVSQVTLEGPIFQGAALETLLLDDVHVGTIRRGAFADLSYIQNVTFRDTHINEVEEGGIGFQMVANSELIIMKSELLGVQKSGIVVKGAALFKMHESKLTTVGEDGLQLDAAGLVSITNSQLQTLDSLKVTVPPGNSFKFVRNVWNGSQVIQLADQLLSSNAILDVSGNSLSCVCDANTGSLVNLPVAKSLLDRNMCDKGLCDRPVNMSLLTSCGDKKVLEAACKAASTDSGTNPGKTSATPGVTQTPKTGKPRSAGNNNAAATVAVSVTTALLLTLPTAAALTL